MKSLIDKSKLSLESWCHLQNSNWSAKWDMTQFKIIASLGKIWWCIPILLITKFPKWQRLSWNCISDLRQRLQKMKTEKSSILGEGRGVSKEVWQMSWIYFFLNTSLPVASAEKYTCNLDIFWFSRKTYSCAKVSIRLGIYIICEQFMWKISLVKIMRYEVKKGVEVKWDVLLRNIINWGRKFWCRRMFIISLRSVIDC